MTRAGSVFHFRVFDIQRDAAFSSLSFVVVIPDD